jgi:hypothetical protein
MRIPVLLLLVVAAFPSVQLGMSKEAALKALEKDGLCVCESGEIPEGDPLAGDAVSLLVACRQCPCPPDLASLIVWFGKTGRVTGVGFAQPREQPKTKKPPKKKPTK